MRYKKTVTVLLFICVAILIISCRKQKIIEEPQIIFEDPVFQEVFNKEEYKEKDGDILPVKLTERSIQQMTSLCLFFSGYNDYSLNDLYKFPNLRSLCINGLTDEAVTELSHMGQLKALYFNSGDPSLKLQPIGKMRNIVALEITGENEDWSFISQMTQLETLVLDRVTVDNLDFVKTLTNLKRLTIEDSNIIDTSALEYLVNVKYMKLAELSNQDQNYSSSIASMKRIEQLAIYRDNSLDQLEFLKEMKKINSLYLMDLGVKKMPEWLTPEEYPELTILSLDETMEQYNVKYLEMYSPIFEERYKKKIPENEFHDERLSFPVLLERMTPLEVFDNQE